MLDKLGKTDIGEATKSVGMVVVIGIVLAVIGGSLGATLNTDESCIGFVISPEGECTDEELAGDSTKMISQFHNLGKGVVSVMAFWFPVAGLMMMAIGLVVLSLSRTVLYTLGLSVALTVSLIMFRDAIPLYVMASLYGAVLALDVMSTVTSKRFPTKECNVIISTLHKRVGMKNAWIAYGIGYAGLFVVGLALLEPAIVLGIMVAVHTVAAVGNIVTEKRQKVQCIAQ